MLRPMLIKSGERKEKIHWQGIEPSNKLTMKLLQSKTSINISERIMKPTFNFYFSDTSKVKNLNEVVLYSPCFIGKWEGWNIKPDVPKLKDSFLHPILSKNKSWKDSTNPTYAAHKHCTDHIHRNYHGTHPAFRRKSHCLYANSCRIQNKSRNNMRIWHASRNLGSAGKRR